MKNKSSFSEAVLWIPGSASNWKVGSGFAYPLKWKLDPDTHQSDRQDPDPDPHQSDKQDPDTDPHQSDVQDPDPYQTGMQNPDPDLYRSDKHDPDPHHLDADPEHGSEGNEIIWSK